jgi:CDGSH-type Zn-finger protein
MTINDDEHKLDSQRIVVIKNGSYSVEGGIPLVSKKQVVSEFGEPLTWKNEGEIPVIDGWYCLCRCGQSSQFPFCDNTHQEIGFDGTEAKEAGLSESRAQAFPGGTRIVVKKDPTLCISSGFCGMRNKSINDLVEESADPTVRSLVIAMVERCPSGSLTYRIEEDEADIEPDLPVQVAATVEITSEGPIAGPLWVTGGIPIELSDGTMLETRKRVTLCNCGKSHNKPLCDGTHRTRAQRELRKKLAQNRGENYLTDCK